MRITFHGFGPVAWIEADVRKRAAKLARHDRALRVCRVVVDVPHRRRLQGDRVRVHIELPVPGETIAVTRDAPGGASRRQLAAVIHEAFDVGRRLLQDYSRRQRFAVRRHRPPRGERGNRRRPAAPDGKAA